MVEKLTIFLSENRPEIVEKVTDAFLGFAEAVKTVAEGIWSIIEAWRAMQQYSARFDSELPSGEAGIMGVPVPGAPLSLFSPKMGGPAGGGPGGGRFGGLSRQGNASVTVDFRNMPRGTRTETRADSDVDLEVMTGYALPGAQ